MPDWTGYRRALGFFVDVYVMAYEKTLRPEWHLLKSRHLRESGDPVTLLSQESLKSLDSRFRGNDENLDAAFK
jgi:hypothetical protein